jgi:hypothetical protein
MTVRTMFCASDVRLDREAPAAQLLDLPHHLVGFRIVAPVVDGDVAALAGQREGDGGADAQAAARHDGALAFEP